MARKKRIKKSVKRRLQVIAKAAPVYLNEAQEAQIDRVAALLGALRKGREERAHDGRA